jgi:hypothetical protein
MKRFVPLAVGVLVLAAFAFAQHATVSASGQSPVGQVTAMPSLPSVPMATPIPALTPLPQSTALATALPGGPIATPIPMNTLMP